MTRVCEMIFGVSSMIKIKFEQKKRKDFVGSFLGIHQHLYTSRDSTSTEQVPDAEFGWIPTECLIQATSIITVVIPPLCQNKLTTAYTVFRQTINSAAREPLQGYGNVWTYGRCMGRIFFSGCGSECSFRTRTRS